MAGKDSANEKRYARRGRAGQGEVEEAFGFSLALLLARSAEIEALAAQRLETRTATGHQAAPDRLPT
ncbi:helix-turn-helix domain-containing protein [Agrobacterium pusense]|jgi:replication initiation protein RepC|uniref:helix-turn-helix domain-containing protein n=1 Tax=Agrobacterium pusense TaxID=648995 RepID=UPI0007D8084C|nr:helix-turn-helix domain-containing protein [Agrobacterium pusense]OAI83033.1 hypothetical protein AYO27_18005 [Rhizobium sp. GHKF11]